jgi:hypothetical protein
MSKSCVSANRVQVIPIPRDPLAHADGGLIAPAERTARNSLVPPIDAYRVVRARSAKPVAFGGVGHIGKCAGIDQNFPPAGARGQTENVGVAMAAGPFTERPCLDHQLNISGNHYRCSAIGEESRDPGRRRRGDPRQRINTHPPGRLLVHVLGARSHSGPLQQDGAGHRRPAKPGAARHTDGTVGLRHRPRSG